MEGFTPACPNPDHAGSHIVRYGFSRSLLFQRYRCEPAAGSFHTFSLPVESHSDSGELLASPPSRSYRHDISEIASALVAIGQGASYRQAALRSSAGKNANGQLVANWVKVFGPVVTNVDVPRRWPAVAAVGAFALQPRPNNVGLVVQVAVSAATPTHPARLWDARIASSQPDRWRSFLERYEGSPRTLVMQRGAELADAALAVWPDSPPRLVDSRSWLRRDVQGHGQPDQADDGIDVTNVDALMQAYAQSRDALIRRLAGRLGHFKLADQVDRLLDLMRMDVNGDARAIQYANLINLAGLAE